MRIYLFGFLRDDFFGRVMVVSDQQSVGGLAAQLTAWGPTPERRGAFMVTNEAGEVLDPATTLGAAGLGNGDIFTVQQDA